MMSIFNFLKKQFEKSNPIDDLTFHPAENTYQKVSSDQKTALYLDLLIDWLRSESIYKNSSHILEEKLKEISRVTEVKTLDLAEKFQALYGNSKEQNQLMEELVTLASGIPVDGEVVKLDDIALSVQQSLSKVIEFLKELSLRAQNVMTKVSQADKTLSEIENSIKEIELINKKTKYLSINSMIEATKTGEDKEGSMAVANEVRELANDTQSITTLIKEQSHQMRFALSETQRILQEVAALDLSESIQAENEIKKMIDGLVVNNQKMSKIMDVTSHTIHEFSETAGNLVKGVQFQDRLQQDIHALTKELAQVNAVFADIKNTTMEGLGDIDLPKMPEFNPHTLNSQALLSSSSSDKEDSVELF